MRPSILLLRLSSLGDIILTTPLIAALRSRYPEGRIDMVMNSEYESLLPVVQGLSRVHLYDKRSGIVGLQRLRGELRKEGYDYVLDLHNVHRTRVLRRGLARNVHVINKRTFRRWLLVHWKKDILTGQPDVIGRYFETAARLGISDLGLGTTLNARHRRHPKRIAIAPGARHWNKRWPPEYYQQLAAALLEQGYDLTFYGSAAEAPLIEDIRARLPPGRHRSLAGDIDLMETAHSIAACSAAITNDSGLLHAATAVGTPVVALFGPTVSTFGFAPRQENAILLEVPGLYCRPCTAIGLDHCPEQHFRCMKKITVERVLEEVLTIACVTPQ